MLHLHNVLRWVILILLLVTLYQAFAKKESIRSSSLWLMIAAHTMLLIGLYQVIAGRFGRLTRKCTIINERLLLPVLLGRAPHFNGGGYCIDHTGPWQSKSAEL